MLKKALKRPDVKVKECVKVKDLVKVKECLKLKDLVKVKVLYVNVVLSARSRAFSCATPLAKATSLL